MAATKNPSPNQDGTRRIPSAPQDGGGGGKLSNGCTAAPVVNPALEARLKAISSGLTIHWSKKEKAILEVGLTKYASFSFLLRCAKIAEQLPHKSIRDVAVYCRPMPERATDPSGKFSAQLAERSSVPSYTLPMLTVNNDDGISHEAIGSATGRLLVDNEPILDQIPANLKSAHIQENISLFSQARDNFLNIFNEMNKMPEIMQQMPPLPVKLNEELANLILQASLPRQS